MTVNMNEVTRKQLQDRFDRLLADALEGNPPHSDTGMNYEVDGALATVALWHPAGEEHVAEAREAFKRQLDSQ